MGEMKFDTSRWKFQTDERVECDLGPELGWVKGVVHGLALECAEVQLVIVHLDQPVGPFKSVAMPATYVRKDNNEASRPQEDPQ